MRNVLEKLRKSWLDLVKGEREVNVIVGRADNNA